MIKEGLAMEQRSVAIRIEYNLDFSIGACSISQSFAPRFTSPVHAVLLYTIVRQKSRNTIDEIAEVR